MIFLLKAVLGASQLSKKVTNQVDLEEYATEIVKTCSDSSSPSMFVSVPQIP